FWIGGFGDQRSWALTNGSEGLTSPGWMVRAALDRFRAWDVPLRVSNVRTQVYRMGLHSESAIHRLLQAEIPTVMLGSSHFSDAAQSYLAGSLPGDAAKLTGAADNSANNASGAAFVSAGGVAS